jgi:hypothetical protein
MKRIFSRGLNYHGQCGLGKDINFSVEKFSEISFKLPIKNIQAGLGHSVALHEGLKNFKIIKINFRYENNFFLGF